jgi:hypothetical protein
MSPLLLLILLHVQLYMYVLTVWMNGMASIDFAMYIFCLETQIAAHREAVPTLGQPHPRILTQTGVATHPGSDVRRRRLLNHGGKNWGQSQAGLSPSWVSPKLR